MVFCVGLGLGAAWKLGWIPLEYLPAASGKLESSTQLEAEVTDAADQLAELPDESPAAWDVEHVEPPVQEGVNQKRNAAPEPTSEPESDEDVPIVRAERSRPVVRTPERKPRKSLVVPDEIRHANHESEAGADNQPSTPKLEFDRPPEKAATPTANRFAEVEEKLSAGEILAAHKLLSKMYWSAKGRPDAELQERLDTTAKKIFFSPQPHFIEPHVVQSGDQLQRIARKYNLSWEYLAALNKTDPKRIREGQKLKVLKGPFAAIVNLRDFALTVHLQGYYVKRYEVGIGRDGSSPIGKFPVLEKLVDPQYTDPEGKVIDGGDPTNPLGKRWLDLGDSYGIHGTIEPDSIGTASSRGCIRLRDADILQVYDFLVKGSLVEIRE
jgi:LysM repeat protein